MELKDIKANIEEKIKSMSFIEDSNRVIMSRDFSGFFGKIRAISVDEYKKLPLEKIKQIEIKRFSETIDGKTYFIERFGMQSFAKKIKDNHDQINKILQILIEVNDPLLYDLILKKISIRCFNQYNNNTIYSSNKIFQSSDKFFHFFYRNYLLLAMVNQAPNESKAAKFRENIVELELFGGHINDKSDAYGDVLDLKHISKYNSLKSLRIYDAGELKSLNIISKFDHLESLIIWGARHKIKSPRSTYTGLSVSDFNLDFDFRLLKQLKHLRMLTIINCANNSNIHLDTIEKVQEYLYRL